MDLIGKKVKHRSWKEGEIISVSGNLIEIKFPCGIKKIQFPESFGDSMNALDSDVQEYIMNIKKEAIAAAEAAKNIELSEMEDRARLRNEEAAPVGRRPAYTISRDGNQKMIFIVFQSDTFEHQANGGYIWAPRINNAGNIVHHWERLTDVRENDVILHCSNGEIRAISEAKGRCYDCPKPKELYSDDDWADAGRKVDCEYVLVDKGVDISKYRREAAASSGYYSPFNVNGTGNQGYLYDLNRDLAKLFIAELVKENPELLKHSFIQDICNDLEI